MLKTNSLFIIFVENNLSKTYDQINWMKGHLREWIEITDPSDYNAEDSLWIKWTDNWLSNDRTIDTLIKFISILIISCNFVKVYTTKQLINLSIKMN